MTQITKNQKLPMSSIEDHNQMLEHQKTQKYLLTIFECGCKLMSGGDREREILPQRYYKVVSVNEIDEYTQFLKTSFWRHPNVDKNTTEKEKNKIPFDEKKWGRYSNIIIEPLSKDLEENYIKGVEDGFFELQRSLYLNDDETTKPKLEVVE